MSPVSRALGAGLLVGALAVVAVLPHLRRRTINQV